MAATATSKKQVQRLDTAIATAQFNLRWAVRHRASDAELARLQAVLARAQAEKRAALR